MVPIRGCNEQWMFLGVPGTGKSWLAREEAWKEATKQQGYMIAHDPTDSFEDKGVTVPHQRYDSPSALTKGVKQHGGSCVHILDVRDGDTVLRTALALAAASMAQAPQHQGMFRPVWVYFDEAVASSEESGPRRLSPLWMDMLGRRRRYGVAPVMTSQSAFFAHRSTLTLASRIYVFRLPDPDDAKRLRACGFTKEMGDVFARIPDREYFQTLNGRVVKVPSRLEPPPPSLTMPGSSDLT